MPELDPMASKTNKTFILVSLNFAMLFLLFCGLGFVIWQSARLVTDLKQDVARAEQTVARISSRLEQTDSQAVVEQLIESAVAAVREEIGNSLTGAGAMEGLAGVPERVESAAETVRIIGERVEQLESDLIARRVAYYLLKGMGDGLSEAAEARKPKED
jgi:hypothetical protein